MGVKNSPVVHILAYLCDAQICKLNYSRNVWRFALFIHDVLETVPWCNIVFPLSSDYVLYMSRECYTVRSPVTVKSLRSWYCSAGQKIRHLVWTQRIHWDVLKNLPLVLILNQVNSIYTLPPRFFKIQFNISCLHPDFPRGLFPPLIFSN